jgi:ankyrin repeat protein
MGDFSRVLISPSALQAIAVGYLRPMVLLPASMVTQMPPEMLEAVIAHELAHIRRFDLWVNLLQRIVETLLFYHPAVWWLSSRLRKERELCCDELAVGATGERLTYASALESMGRARILARRPALAAGFGRDDMPILSRVRYVLGLAPRPQDSRFWLAGVVTIMLLAALAIPTTLVLTRRTAGAERDVEHGLFGMLADPKVNAEGQEILRSFAEVNRYWLVGPPAVIKNYSYDYKSRNFWGEEVRDEKISVTNTGDGRIFKAGTSYEYTHYPILRRLAANPSAALVTRIEKDKRTTRVHFIYNGLSERRDKDNVERDEPEVASKAGSLLLDSEKMVPLMLKTSTKEVTFHDYISAGDGRYVPLRISRGPDFDLKYRLYEPGLWLSAGGTTTRIYYGRISSISNVRIDGRRAEKVDAVLVEVAEIPKADKVSRPMRNAGERFINLVLGKESMTLDGEAVRWETIWEHLAEIRDPRQVGLHLLVPGEIEAERLREAKTLVSFLSRQFNFGYLSGIGDRALKENHFPRRFCFAARLEFGKKIWFWQQAAGGKFRQERYRTKEGWAYDPNQTHLEWATIYLTGIDFDKSLAGDEVKGYLGITTQSIPISKFRVTVRLLDEQGKVIGEGSTEAGGDGSILSGRVLTGFGEHPLSLGRWEDAAKATSFEISVEPVPDVEADSESEPIRESSERDRELVRLLLELKDDDHRKREGAARKLGELKDSRAVDGLVRALKDGDAGVRSAAILSLGHIGDWRAVWPLGEICRDKKSESFVEALRAMGNFSGWRPEKVLIRALSYDGPHPGVRKIAAQTLTKIGWEPTEKKEKLLYLMALEKWDDAIAAGSAVDIEVGDNHVKGRFEKGVPIILPFELCTEQNPEILPYPTIEFGRPYDKIRADLSIRCLSQPETIWEGRIDLIGRTLGSSEERLLKVVEATFSGGASEKYAGGEEQKVRSSFGKEIQLDDVTHFRVSIQKAEAKGPSGPDALEDTGPAVSMVEEAYESAQEKGERILEQMAEVNRHWILGPTDYVRNYSYDFITTEREQDCSVTKKTERIEISDPYAADRTFRQGITYYSVLHKLLSEPSSAVITAIRERGDHIQLDFTFEEPVRVECGNGLSRTTGHYFSGSVHTGYVSIDAEKMVPDRVITNLFEEEFRGYVPVGEGHFVPERVEVKRKIDFQERFRFEWRFELRGIGLWLFRHGEFRPSDRHDDREVSIENVEINDPAISETKVPTSDVTLEESPLAASGVAGEKHDGEAEGTNDRAVGSSAADERLPGRDIPVKWAISSPQFAFAAVCEAVDEADTELDSSGIVSAVGTFKPVQILSGSEAIGSPFRLSYSFHSPDFDSKHSRPAIRRGEQVIWIVHRRGPEGYFGVKALSETGENRSLVVGLCRTAENINAYWQAIVSGDLEKVRESIENDPNLVSAVDARGKSSSGLPALGLAIRHGHTEIVELLLSKGADANRRLPHRQTGPLHGAARKGRADLVELLVAHGADVNGRKNDFQFRPLCYATTAEAAETLIANGAEVNIRDHHRMTPLHSIARLGNTEAVEVLVRHGADVDAVDASGGTPLHRAVDWGHIQTAARLLAMGADIDSKDGRSTPLNRAIRSRDGRGNREMAAFLVSQGARHTIGDLAWLGDIGRLRDYLRKHPGAANKREHGEPILFGAIRQGHSATAELLIDSGASLDVRDRFEEPPLHVAAYAGHRLMVEMLLAKGADVNQKGPYGELALHWAVAKGHAEVVEVLLGAGCDVNARAEKQRVNMDTMTDKNADAVQEWLRFLADCEAQRQAEIVGSGLQIMGPLQLAFAAGDSPLHVASQWGHEEITQALLAKGADANIKNKWDQTPLHYASVLYHKEVVELLLDAGADVNVEDKNGRSPLSLALLPRGLERNKIAELLRARGASVRPENRNKVGGLAWGRIPVKGLQARLAVKSIAEKREPRVALTFELRNVSNKPIRILRLSEKNRFWGFCLPLEVRVAEKTLTYQGPVLTPPPPPGRSSYIDLSPGAVDSGEAVMVPGYWGLEDPFGAELTFVFQNSRDSEHCEYDNEERKWLSITGLWTGKVRSNTVKLDKTILGTTAASPTMKADAEVEIDKRKAPNGLQWVDQDSGEILFDIGDIVRFDWSKQIFELTRSAAMDFTTRLIDLDTEFEVQLGKDTVYSGSLVSVFSSRSYRHPVIRFPKSRNGLRPPLFAIDGGYPRDFSTNELRFSELLEKALQQADVLGQIDVNNPPSPIEKVAHGWFGEKNGLRAYVEVFPETFRLFRSLRVHIHLTGPNYLNEGHVVDVNATLVSGKGKSKFSTSKTFPFDGGGWKNTYVLEMDPWGPAREWTSGSVKPGRAELSIEVFTKKILDASTKQYSDPIDHVKTAAMNVNILPGRRLLPDLPNEPYKVDFVMIAANSIKGRLVDKEGRPLAGKQLSLTGEGSYRGTSALAGIETDEDGRFEVTEVPPKIFWFEYRYERRKQIKTVPISFSEPGEYDVVLVYAEHEHGPPTLEVEEAELRRTGMPDANRDMPKICTLSDKALMSLDVHGSSTARVIDKRDTPGAGVEFDIYFPPGGYSLSYVSSRTSGKGTLTHIDLNEYIGYALNFSLVDFESSTPDANRARLGVGANIGSPGRYRPAFIKLAGDKEPVVSSTGFEPAEMRSLDYLGFTAYLLTKEISNTDGLTITIKIEAVPGAHKIEPKKDMPDDRPSLPVTLVSAEKKEGVSSYHWRILRESACRLHLGWFSYYHKEIYDYAGWGTAEPKAGPVDIKITIRRENGFFRLIHEYRQDKSDKPIRKEDRIELPENCELDESHLAEPIILTNARNQTLWQARVIHIHEHGTQKRFTVRFIVRALKAGESTDTFEPPFDPLGIPPDYPFVVTGKVTDANGRPMYGATVRASTGIATLLGRSETVTDAKGRYSLRFGPGWGFKVDDTDRWGVGIQAAVIWASKDGYYEANLCRQGDLAMSGKPVNPDTIPRRWRYKGVVLPNEPYEVDFVMAPAASIRGRLVDRQGRPMAGKQLSMPGEALYPATNVLASIETDEDGRFEVTEVPPKIFWFEYRYERRKEIRTVPISFSEAGEYDVVLVYEENEHGPATLRVEKAELKRPRSPEPEVGAQETSSSASPTEPEDQDVQSKGQELLTRIAQVNRYWLMGPGPYWVRLALFCIS